MRRRKDQDRRTRSARPSAGYATLTSIRSRNATLHTRDRTQYIRAIRSFLVVSNLGCEGVNRRCTRDTRKEMRGFRLSHRKSLVNSRSNKVVNIASTKMMKKNFELRHGRTCSGHPTSSRFAEDVDARDKPGHDDIDRRPSAVLTPDRWRSCRARPARRPAARSARGRASTRRNRGRSRGRTRPRRDRRHARRRCRP